MNWQPIETAPKDGTFILGYYADRPWLWDIVQWDAGYLGGAWWGGGHENDGPLFPPTHWMPLPDPPVATKMERAA
jgi:hypothetical protein